MSSTMEDVKSESSPSAEESSAPGECDTCSAVPRCQKEATIQSQSNAAEESKDPSELITFPGPGEIVYSPMYGKYVVATKNIQEGELICVERPLVLAPSIFGITSTSYSHYDFAFCLACYKVIRKCARYTCSKCKWSICGLECEQNEIHRLQECKILAENSVLPKGKYFDYLCIKVLRCLLLRESAPDKWKCILRFESHKTHRKEKTNYKSALGLIFKFVRFRCELTEFDEDIIDHVFGVIMINSFSAFKDTSRHISMLFDKVNFLAHDCHPNSYTKVVNLTKRDSIEQEAFQCPDYDVSNSELAIKIYAKRPIKKGRRITISYIDRTMPVDQRREKLKEKFFFDCTCSKCLSELRKQSIRMEDAALSVHEGRKQLKEHSVFDCSCFKCQSDQSESELSIGMDEAGPKVPSFVCTLPCCNSTPKNGWKFPVCVILIFCGSLLIALFLIWCLFLLRQSS